MSNGKTPRDRLARLEILTQINTVILAGHVGIPLIPFLFAVLA